MSGAVLDDHAEAAGIADAAHRRRQHRDEEAVLDLGQPAIELGLDACADWRGSLARFSKESSTRKIAPALGELVKVAPEKPTTFTPWATPGTLERDVERALLHRVGARQRRAGRQLHHDDHVAGVDLRDEADRRLAELVEAETDHDDIDRPP